MNDSELVERLFSRDESVLGDIKTQTGNYCLYIARNILSSEQDCEECLNDVLLAAWNSIPPQRPKNLKTYLGKIMRECAIDRLRKHNAGKRPAPGDVLPLDEFEYTVGSNGVQSEIERAELSKTVTVFLGTLKETERNVFIRRYWFFDPIESISERFGFGKGKVKMMLKRTRDRLAEYLKKEGYPYEK